ncbi:MAG: hypothetical protein IJ466_05895 [Clostridia bacterium]|nr:hypothetical protein [Clostridia bacterium]
MKIMMIPGERNEELILKAREATAAYLADENSDAIDNLIDEYGLVDAFDALYYACENGEKMLRQLTDYFLDLLYCDEANSYISRMTGIER